MFHCLFGSALLLCADLHGLSDTPIRRAGTFAGTVEDRSGNRREGSDVAGERVDGDGLGEVEGQEHAVIVIAGQDDHAVMHHIVSHFLRLMTAKEKIDIEQFTQ